MPTDPELSKAVARIIAPFSVSVPPEDALDDAEVIIALVVARCAEAIEAQKAVFSSEEYATPQPLGSMSERFACDKCKQAVLALAPQEPSR